MDSTRRRFLQKIALGGLAGLAVTVELAPASRTRAQGEEAGKLAGRLRRLRPTRPRLHFDARGRSKLRERADSTHRRYARLLFEWVERNGKWVPPTELRDRDLNEVVLEQCGAFVTNAALAFVLSQKAAHMDLARSWALGMCDMPRGEVRNYGLGIYAAGLARAYDWLYESWSDAERRRLREHLRRLVELLYLGSIPKSGKGQWWADAHLHHDHWIPVGGFGEAALALLGEVEEAARWAAHAKLDFDVCFSWLGDDGAWHEGAADWCYTLAPLLWFYGAWQSVVGEDLHDVPWLRNTASYRLYHWLPDDSYVYLNDSFRSGRYNTSGSASCHLLRRLASLFGDGHAQWLAGRDEVFDLKPAPKGVFQAPYEGSSYRARRTEYPHPASQCVAWNVLWYDPSVPPEPPEKLARCRRFANEDLAILRSGWDDRATVLSIACGPPAGQRCAARVRAGERRSTSNFSHAHADYNSLTLFAGGEYVIIPPGYARRSSRFQNTVSVNGADFRTDPGLEVRLDAVVEGPDFCYALGDARGAFLPALRVREYRRHLVLLAGAVVVYDKLRLADTATRPWNRFQWTLHSDPRAHELSVGDRSATWRSLAAERPALTLHVLEPDDFAWERSVLRSRQGVPMLEALRLVRPEWYSRRMDVVTVLSWEEQPSRPALLRQGKLMTLVWKDRPRRPAVGFALTPIAEAKVPEELPPSLGKRPMVLFGHDPEQPERYLELGRVR